MRRFELPRVDDGEGNLVRACSWCGDPVRQTSAVGRQRTHCKRTHRQRAFEARRLGVLSPAAKKLAAASGIDVDVFTPDQVEEQLALLFPEGQAAE